MVSALKFRFSTDPTKNINFFRLAQGARNKKPHKKWEIGLMNKISKAKILTGEERLMFKLLYELAARKQDLTTLTYDCFGPFIPTKGS